MEVKTTGDIVASSEAQRPLLCSVKESAFMKCRLLLLLLNENLLCGDERGEQKAVAKVGG